VCSCTAAVTVLGTLDTGATYAGGAITADEATATTASPTAEKAAQTFTTEVKIVSAAKVKIVASGPTAGTFTFADTYVGTTDITNLMVPLTISNGNTGDTSLNRQDAKGVKVQLSDNVNFTLTFGTDTATDCQPGLDGTFVLSETGTAGDGLNGEESCLVYVQFNPEKVGAINATVSLTSTVGGTASVALKGNGLGDLTIDPQGATDAREVVTATGLMLTVTNNGSDKTGLLRTTLSNKTAFAVVEDSCFGQMLYGGQSCTVTVVFTGTVAATAVNTDVTVSDGATSSANSVTAYLKSPVTGG
jgi:hypothetical protein